VTSSPSNRLRGVDGVSFCKRLTSQTGWVPFKNQTIRLTGPVVAFNGHKVRSGPGAGGSPWSCRRQSPTRHSENQLTFEMLVTPTKTCVMSIFVPGLEAQEMDVRLAVRMPVVGRGTSRRPDR